MKKVIIAAIALTFAGYSNAAPVNTPDTNTVVSTTDTLVASADTRTPVKVEDLPEAVKKSLASSAFEGWSPVAAYWVEGTAVSYYEITVTKEAEKKYVKLDKEGNSVQ